MTRPGRRTTAGARLATRGNPVAALALVCGLAALAARPAAAAPGDDVRLFKDHSPLPDPPIASTLQPFYGAPAVLFLELDGATITQVPGVSSADTNTSFLCGATIGAFKHEPLGVDRAAVVSKLTTLVRALFGDFDVEVVTKRPAVAPYQMVVVGGTPAVCGFSAGYSGMAPLDCDNASESDVVFVFSDGITSLELLAVVIAHEAGHSYGLPHSTKACDVMSNMLCDGPGGPLAKTFLDQSAAVTPDHKGKCGLSTTNSWSQLLKVLGPKPGPGVDAGPDAGIATAPEGCAVGLSAGRRSGLRWLGGLLLIVIIPLIRRSRRHKLTERWHGHPGRTDLGNGRQELE